MSGIEYSFLQRKMLAGDFLIFSPSLLALCWPVPFVVLIIFLFSPTSSLMLSPQRLEALPYRIQPSVYPPCLHPVRSDMWTQPPQCSSTRAPSPPDPVEGLSKPHTTPWWPLPCHSQWIRCSPVWCLSTMAYSLPDPKSERTLHRQYSLNIGTGLLWGTVVFLGSIGLKHSRETELARLPPQGMSNPSSLGESIASQNIQK